MFHELIKQKQIKKQVLAKKSETDPENLSKIDTPEIIYTSKIKNSNILDFYIFDVNRKILDLTDFAQILNWSDQILACVDAVIFSVLGPQQILRILEILKFGEKYPNFENLAKFLDTLNQNLLEISNDLQDPGNLENLQNLEREAYNKIYENLLVNLHTLLQIWILDASKNSHLEKLKTSEMTDNLIASLKSKLDCLFDLIQTSCQSNFTNSVKHSKILSKKNDIYWLLNYEE